jgi:hypothetical protein
MNESRSKLIISLLVTIALLIPAISGIAYATSNRRNDSKKVIYVEKLFYTIEIFKKPFRVLLKKDGRVISITVDNQSIFFVRGDNTYYITNVTTYSRDGRKISLTLGTTLENTKALCNITTNSRSYKVSWHIKDSEINDEIGESYDLDCGGHWYGLGEIGSLKAPWPLETENFDIITEPSDYLMTEPFLFTSSGIGYYINLFRLEYLKLPNLKGFELCIAF